MDKLRAYFQACEDSEIVSWTKQEGFVWIKSERFPSVLNDLRVSSQGENPILLIHTVNDERQLGQGFVIYLVLHWSGDFSLTLASRGIEDSFPSLTAVWPALNWSEREVQDLFGLKAVGHPDPRPLVFHPGWPEGFFPLRKREANYLENKGFVPGELPISPAQGEGTFEISVGPIHAGIIEPGHFRFQTIGETILHIEAQLFYTHKGVEKLLEGKDLFEGLAIIEHLCGVCTVSHALAYCEAVEKLAGFQPSHTVLGWRTVLAELERLYNHLGDIGNMCAGVGFALGNANGLQAKEHVQRLNREIFGHRFLRGAVVPGGVDRIPDEEQTSILAERLREIREDSEDWISLILEHDGFRQRAVTTGVLKHESAIDLGVTGPAARASGVAIDWRQCHAYLLYPELNVEPQVEADCDVMSRLIVRSREVKQSFELLEVLLEKMKYLRDWKERANEQTHEQGKSEFRKAWETNTKPHSFAWGCAESPRGTDAVWLMVDENRKIYRCRIRSAAYANWPAVPLAVLGNIVPDFPLINKSFELCYSCCDR
ncbi:NADH-quinone oxidoreductase subunit C [Desulfitobacterium metallireducens]|uniref:NADH dehydrogenase n=1 Tax=Desulfitobacterium metallireducens DSM 15288 TaxID=871968 RepID=W0EEB8_9FIRM|nr:NADH-quinone oxidoreductase subunit C [Desulfitobacterium metallireducens]AHF07858.1 NADH dehydrogenase [Desulfitobacterium metallireducens DSM 15288]